MTWKKLRDIITTPGNGQLTARTHAVSSFLRLHLSVPGQLDIIASDEEKVVITTDENLHDFFEVVNSGRTLYITLAAKLRQPGFTALHIQVFVRQLDTVHLACSGDVVSTTPIVSADPLEISIRSNGHTSLHLQAPAIKLSAASNGNVILQGACTDLEVKTQSNGDFDARALLAQNVVFHNRSNGNAWLYSGETLRIRHRANGFVHYFGPGRVKDVVQHGSGEIRHAE